MDEIFAIPQEVYPIITKFAMVNRFTNDEYVGIVAATKTDVEVEAWFGKFSIATQVRLDNAIAIEGMDFLVSKGLLTKDRATQILTAPVQSSERP